MKVTKEIFLEQGEKKVTKFSIKPDEGKEENALFMLKKEIEQFVTENRLNHIQFIDPLNKYNILIIEGI